MLPQLYSSIHDSYPEPELLAHISRADGIITLHIAATAMQLGLLEACIVAVLVLQSGRPIY